MAVFVFGRGRKIRTLDTRFWRPMLYQLSYTPIKLKRCINYLISQIKHFFYNPHILIGIRNI